MGNCVFTGFQFHDVDQEHDHDRDKVKVITSNGGIMELNPPITVEHVTNEFPGHAIFRTPRNDIFSADPLLHSDYLHAGEVYHLLPLNPYPNTHFHKMDTLCGPGNFTPYRMSCSFKRGGDRDQVGPEVFPRYNSTGVWKVKLVISPEQLSEILAQDNRTEELIESLRTVAKCRNAGLSTSANSDKSSVCSTTWKG